MQLSDIDYVLPVDLIAQTPIEPRDSARLLVDQGLSQPLHRHVLDLFEKGPTVAILAFNHIETT
jgi:S-adenosylmethionine:tRNA ribosyltransferase-isomerase